MMMTLLHPFCMFVRRPCFYLRIFYGAL